MHFVDRTTTANPPIAKLKQLNSQYQQDWANYNTARLNKTNPLPSRPLSKWLHNDIREPLSKLFLKTCGYCGIHTDIGADAEVDHFFPTSLDGEAQFVFDWNNYIWSCPSCNRLKGNAYPFLNPTDFAMTKAAPSALALSISEVITFLSVN